MRSLPAVRACASRRADGARAAVGPELVREIFARLWGTLPGMTDATTTPPTKPETTVPEREPPQLLAALRAHLTTEPELQRDLLTALFDPTPRLRDDACKRVRVFLATCELPELVVSSDTPAPAMPGTTFAQRAPIFAAR